MASIIYLYDLKGFQITFDHFDIRYGCNIPDDEYVRPIIAKGNIIEGVEAKT